MRTIYIFLCHAVVSSSLTLLNKQVASTVDFPWVVVFLQCLGSAIMGLIIDIPMRSIKPIQKAHLPNAILISFLFTTCLVSSISGLSRVHVPMAVVGRNLTPFFTALLELVVLHKALSGKTLLSLVIGLGGGIIYLFGDANASTAGSSFVLLNNMCLSVTSVTENKVARDLKKDQSPLGMGLWRNALALPFVVIIMLCNFDRSYNEFQAVLRAEWTFWFRIILTSIFGAVTGLCLFELQTRVRATTIQFAGLSYKLISTLLSFVFFPKSLNDLGAVAVVGYLLSTASISIYTFDFKPAQWFRRLGVAPHNIA